MTYSNDFSSATWFKTRAVVSANSTTSPSGATDADLLTTQSGGWAGLAFPSVSITSGTTYTGSIYAKANGYNWLQIGGSSPRFAATFANVNLSDGSLGNSNIDVIVTPAGNGWYRIAITAVATQTTSNAPFFVAVYNTDVASRLPDSPDDGTSGILVYGAQAEAGSFPTSYIPTTGATATRASDLAEIPTSAFGYNNGAGSIAVEFKSNKPSSSLGYGAFVLSDGSPTNRIIHYANSQYHRGYVRNTSGTQVDITAGSRGAPSELVKFAIAFAENNFAASLNGATAVTDTSVTIPSGLSKLALGYFYPTNPNTNLLNGHIKSIQYYPRRLTDTQLQELTT